MAVVLVALFPIVLLINSQMAWLGIGVGILLLYRDLRQEARAQGLRSRPSAAVRRGTPSTKTARGRRRPTMPARIKSQSIDVMSRA